MGNDLGKEMPHITIFADHQIYKYLQFIELTLNKDLRSSELLG